MSRNEAPRVLSPNIFSLNSHVHFYHTCMGFARLFLIRKLRLNRVLPVIAHLRWIVIARCLILLFACFLLVVYTYVITLFVANTTSRRPSGTLGKIYNLALRPSSKTNSAKDSIKKMDTFLESYQNNLTLSGEEGFSDWNSTETEQDLPFNRSGCRVLDTRPVAHHRTILVSQRACNESYFVLVLATSGVGNFYRRMVIRNTWGRDRVIGHLAWKMFFLVEIPEQEESLRMLSCEVERFDDIIYGAFDYRYTLTRKLQMGFEWALLYCKFQYLVGCDDDSYLDIPNIFQYLQKQDIVPANELYAGHVLYEAPVLRSGSSGVSKAEYKKKIYPRHCYVGGFMMARDVVSCMTEKFKETKVLKVTGGYVGELALKCGVDALHDGRFLMPSTPKGCVFNAHALIHYGVRSRKCMLYLHVNHLMLER